ncbi:hypothetical protein C0993_008756 [Termitomyces sp. T159_Od127]|nr:hypothetical protein C0993_008756 [Termitomyces sp. T159_Od127]
MPAPSAPSLANSVASRDLALSQHAPKVVDFLQASLIVLNRPPAQYPVVILAKDLCTSAQYNGLMAIQQKEAAVSKGKVKAMPLDDESNYGEEESEQEHDLEEGKTLQEKLQQVAWNKCIAKKKANIAAAHTAQVKKAVNNFLDGGPGLDLYCKAMASYNAVFTDRLIIFQHGQQLDVQQVHVPNNQACNFSNNNALRVLLHNHIPLDWVDHTYTYSVVYLKQQFHQLTMSLDIFCKINKCKQCLITYGTPPAILQWDGWCKMTEENHYHLMFKHDKERYQPDYTPSKARGLYYYIGMDPN